MGGLIMTAIVLGATLILALIIYEIIQLRKPDYRKIINTERTCGAPNFKARSRCRFAKLVRRKIAEGTIMACRSYYNDRCQNTSPMKTRRKKRTTPR